MDFRNVSCLLPGCVTSPDLLHRNRESELWFKPALWVVGQGGDGPVEGPRVQVGGMARTGV